MLVLLLSVEVSVFVVDEEVVEVARETTLILEVPLSEASTLSGVVINEVVVPAEVYSTGERLLTGADTSDVAFTPPAVNASFPVPELLTGIKENLEKSTGLFVLDIFCPLLFCWDKPDDCCTTPLAEALFCNRRERNCSKISRTKAAIFVNVG
ncbi:hypothetical protein ACFFW8_04675 [Erwinia tracheiphila]